MDSQLIPKKNQMITPINVMIIQEKNHLMRNLNVIHQNILVIAVSLIRNHARMLKFQFGAIIVGADVMRDGETTKKQRTVNVTIMFLLTVHLRKCPSLLTIFVMIRFMTLLMAN